MYYVLLHTVYGVHMAHFPNESCLLVSSEAGMELVILL